MAMRFYPWHVDDADWDEQERRRPDEHDRRFRGIDYDEDSERYARPGYDEGFFGHSSLYGTRDPRHETYRSYDPDTRNFRRNRQHERTVNRLRQWMHEGPHTGRGPKDYVRSDASILEEACERLTRHGYVDATGITLKVEEGEVTLEGTVANRKEKRMAEDALESISGVRDIHNRLRVRREDEVEQVRGI
jgi:hypothetical protein